MASVPFNNLITFSRGSNATLTGPTGLIQWAPANLLPFSEQFDNAAWTKNATTVSANSTVAPDGTSTADTVTPSTANSAHNIYASFTYTAATHTLSVYVKPNGYNWVKLGSMFTGQGVFFDVSNGVVGTQNAGYTGTITAAGNGWYRCAVTQTATAGADLPGLYVASSGSVVSFAGDGTSGIYIWGAQLELGSAATTYNSTTVKNLLGFSEAFDNAAWTKSNASIVTGAQANPVNGAFNAQKLMEDTSTGLHRMFLSFTPSAAGTPFVFSMYAKAAGRTNIVLACGGTGFTAVDANFNLANGTTSAGTITPVGNGWYRCSLPITAAAASAGLLYAYISSAASYTGDGNSGVYIYGAQLSDSASLDPYVPTPAAAPSSTAYYGPRFDYDPVTLAPKGLLVEEARTNVVTYSEQLDNVAWTKTAVTVTANATTSPDGTVNADAIYQTAVSSLQSVNSAVFVATSGVTYTLSVYLKAGTSRFVQVTFPSTAMGATQYANIDLTDVTVTASAASTVSVNSVGNGWVRVNYTVAAVAPSNLSPFIIAIDSGTAARGPTITGNAANFFYVYGVQVEAGAFATSYIPTVASQVTRTPDQCSIVAPNFAPWYNASEGTLLIEALLSPDADSGSGNYYAAISDGTAANSIHIVDVNGTISQVVTGGVTQFNQTVGAEPTGILKAALAYAANNTVSSANGAIGATDTSVSIPTVNRLSIGSAASLGSSLCGHIRSIRYYPVRLADFQLQALTA